MPKADPDQRQGTKNKPKLDGATDNDKLGDLSSMRYQHQAKWVMNAYWAKAPMNLKDDEAKREQIWQNFMSFAKLDIDKAKGCDLHQHRAHQFLEKQEGGAITFLDLKGKMKDLDSDHNLRLSLAEYLVHQHGLDVKYLVNVVANVDAKHLAQLEACQKMLEDAEEAAQAAETAREESVALLAQIKAWKKKRNDEIARLQAIIDDPAVTNVKRMKAKHEQMDVKTGARAKRKGNKSANPDFLHVAEIKQKAAVRRQKKAAKVCAAALKEATAAFEVLSAIKGVASEGTMWWMGRELKEMEQYCSKAQFARKKRQLNKKMKNATIA